LLGYDYGLGLYNLAMAVLNKVVQHNYSRA